MAIASKTIVWGVVIGGAVIVVLAISKHVAATPTASGGGTRQSGGGGTDYTSLVGGGFAFLNNVLGKFTGASFDGSSASDNSTNGFQDSGPGGYPASFEQPNIDLSGGGSEDFSGDFDYTDTFGDIA